jgi:putative peptide zinc metalloprotease protein
MSTTVLEVPAPAGSPARPRTEVLRRADGIELIGEFEDSGFIDPPKLARRADGQVVQLTDLLFAIAEASDGRRDVDDVATVVAEKTGRPVSAGNVLHLAEEKLRPLGVLALADGTTPELKKREPLMALRHRKPLLPERAVNRGAGLFTWLHRPFVTVAVLITLAAFDFWLFGLHGIAGGLRSAIYNPVLLLAIFASVVVATAFHEFGHASACRYGGARPGVMGIGLYLVYPAFYCDVTDAYRLNRAGRLRTDLGGVYFNSIFALLAGVVFFLTGEEAALLAAVLQHVIMFQQLLPLLRFDGYYVMTDLTGVPDILSRIKPIFRSLVRGRRREPKVAELKPWVRVAVTVYLVVLIPTLAFLFTWMVMGAPRIFATVHDSLGLQIDRLGNVDDPAEAGVGGVRMLMLVLPVASMSLSVGRTSRMVGRGLTRWARGSAARGSAATLAAVAVLGAVAYVWWPNGDYQPIRPGERGTLGETFAAMPDLVGGRPSFTPRRELDYGSVPTVREDEAAERRAQETDAERREPRSGEAAPPGTAGDDASAGPGADAPTPPTSGRDEDDDVSGLDPPAIDMPPDSGGSSTTQTAPSDSGTATTQPAPTDSGGTTTSEPTPTTTTPAPTTTTPAPTGTQTTPTEPAPSGTSTTTTPETGSATTTTTPEATTTTPDTTTTTTTPETTTTTTPTP